MRKSKNEPTNSTEKQEGNEMNDENQEGNEMNDFDFSSEFDIDPSLLSEEFNCKRPKRFPYGVVVNSENAGLFIPEKNLSKAGWLSEPGNSRLRTWVSRRLVADFIKEKTFKIWFSVV
jgi:hypothetical protein